MSSPFGPGALRFLTQLERNNTREWFKANAERYEGEVREPALAFIDRMARHVERISPHLLAESRKVGGSLMRIHRDVRFSKDKRPYKTNLGIQFRHESGRDVHAPGLYVHVERSGCFLGAGMWHPDRDALAAVRRAIDEDPDGWLAVRDGRRFRRDWSLDGESLRRAPRGWPADHPLIEDLRRTDHIAVLEFPASDLTRADFVTRTAKRFERAAGYVGWLTRAQELPF